MPDQTIQGTVINVGTTSKQIFSSGNPSLQLLTLRRDNDQAAAPVNGSYGGFSANAEVRKAFFDSLSGQQTLKIHYDSQGSVWKVEKLLPNGSWTEV